jgi:heterodisulfide reductase subunit C
VACPKEIRVTDIMYAAKRLAIQEGIHPKRFPTPALAQAFFKNFFTNAQIVREIGGILALFCLACSGPFGIFQ